MAKKWIYILKIITLLCVTAIAITGSIMGIFGWGSVAAIAILMLLVVF